MKPLRGLALLLLAAGTPEPQGMIQERLTHADSVLHRGAADLPAKLPEVSLSREARAHFSP